MIQILKPDFEFTDARGKLTQLVHSGYEQVNVLESRAGVLRGGHYHKISREAFYVISGSVELSAGKNGQDQKYLFSEGDFFLIEPFVVHSMYFPEDCILLVLYDKCVESENGDKDIYQV